MSEQALELVKSLFLAVASREETTEEQRQALASMDNFEAGACFKKLDKDNKGYISKSDISSLLTSNEITDVPEESISHMIKYFDSMESDKLSMNDFSQILLPCANDYLRNRATNRRLSHEVDSFSKEVQEQLSSLIQKECEYHTEVESIKKKISEAENSDCKEIFKALDKNKYGYLDASMIQEFLKNQDCEVSKTDVNSIVRRFDVTADARISYGEFVEGITPADASPKPSEEFSKSRSAFPYNNLRSSGHYANYSSNMKDLDRKDYGFDYHSRPQYQLHTYSSPSRGERYQSQGCSSSIAPPSEYLAASRSPYGPSSRPTGSASGLAEYHRGGQAPHFRNCTGAAEPENNAAYHSHQQRAHFDRAEEKFRYDDFGNRTAEPSKPSHSGEQRDRDGRIGDYDRNYQQRSSYVGYAGYRSSEGKYHDPIKPFGSQLQDQKYESPTRSPDKYGSDKYKDSQFNSTDQVSRPGVGYFRSERSPGYENRNQIYSSSTSQSMGNIRNALYSPSRGSHNKHGLMSSPSRYQTSPTSDHKRKDYPIYPGGYAKMSSSIHNEEKQNFKSYETPNRYRNRHSAERSNSRYQPQISNYLSQSPHRYNADMIQKRNDYSSTNKAREYNAYNKFDRSPALGSYSRPQSKYSYSESRRPRSEYGRGSFNRSMPTGGSTYHGKSGSTNFSRPSYTAYDKGNRYGFAPSAGLPSHGLGTNPGYERPMPSSSAIRPRTPPRTASMANPNESGSKANMNTPPKASKGAFNMAVSPETAAKNGGGWSFVPSPEVAKAGDKN
ncbi:unnamed protein product [Moneuplotes crassus]|uniref:EF-hand domain-containing protein n=1 Tax=Euplotes crassus TaxID=5936 RepID=A0AAD2DBQ4_EUPCR|nr:unnamed protein product [Moneuplotes crassus]